jgi:VanZ family protein
MQNPFSSARGNKCVWQLALAGYWLTLAIATHLPKETTTLPGGGFDKAAHLGAFAVLAVLCAGAWPPTIRRRSLSQLLWISILVAVYGAIDEWTQSFVGRQTSLGDWLADVAGAAIGLGLFAWFRRHSPL